MIPLTMTVGPTVQKKEWENGLTVVPLLIGVLIPEGRIIKYMCSFMAIKWWGCYRDPRLSTVSTT